MYQMGNQNFAISSSVLSFSASFRTKFPVPNSCATDHLATCEELDDQIMLPVWLRRTSSTSSSNVNNPEEVSGLFLFATQTTDWTGIFWYHIPKYGTFELVVDVEPVSVGAKKLKKNLLRTKDQGAANSQIEEVGFQFPHWFHDFPFHYFKIKIKSLTLPPVGKL